MGIYPWEIRHGFPQGKPAATESRYPTLINYKLHAGSFRVSTIHNRNLTWTTGSLTCARDRSCACVYARGLLSTPTRNQHNILFGLGKTHKLFLCSWRDSNLGSLDLESEAVLYQLSHRVTHRCYNWAPKETLGMSLRANNQEVCRKWSFYFSDSFSLAERVTLKVFAQSMLPESCTNNIITSNTRAPHWTRMLS